MVSINTISVTIYSIILLVLHIFLPIKILERYIYGSEYISGDKITKVDCGYCEPETKESEHEPNRSKIIHHR